MRRRKAEIEKVCSWEFNEPFSTVTGYRYVNMPRFKHKKKPISMIKALEVHGKLKERKDDI